MKMELSQCLTIFQKNRCGDINWKYSYVCNYISYEFQDASRR